MDVSIREADCTRWGLMWTRLTETFHEGGTRAVWFKVLGETVYRRLLLLERPFDVPIPEIHSRLPIIIQELETTEAEEYLRFRPGTTRAEIRRRFEAQHRCFVARSQGGRLVGNSWVAEAHAWSHYLSQELALGPGDLYVYDTFTHPHSRGHAVAPAIGVAILRHFRGSGHRRIIRAISPENQASLRVASKNGYRPYGMMGYVGIGPWRKHFFRVMRG
jgi:GNAT superfamily N-acetyltransferase